VSLLLDTSVLLWWLDGGGRLSPAARAAIADGRRAVSVSCVSIWEIVIKQALGKIEVPPEFQLVVADEGFRRLPISPEHAFAVAELPDHHRDPFDRMLVAQCRLEGLTLVTADARIKRYDVPVIDA